MPIVFTEGDISYTLSKKRSIRLWILNVVEGQGKHCGDIQYVFCSGEFIYQMNLKYLHHNTDTDIITFNYNTTNSISGDIYINIPMVRANAKTYRVPVYTELHRVMIHGVLHLLGYNDKSKQEKQEMRKQEDTMLSLLKA